MVLSTRLFRIVTLVTLLAILPYSASGATFYVDPSGNDTNSGLNIQQPLKTLQRGVEKARNGDIVLALPGIYQESVSIKNSGVILRSSTKWQAQIKNSPGFGVRIYANNCTIDGFQVIDSFSDGIAVSASNNSVLNNFVYNSGWGIPHGSTQETYRNGGQGIFVAGAAHSTIISGNYVEKSGEHGLYIADGSDFDVVQNNTIVSNGTPGGIYGGNGIQFNCPGKNSCTNIEISDNRIEGNLANGIVAIGLVDSVIINNTLVTNGAKIKAQVLFSSYTKNNTVTFNTVSGSEYKRPAIEFIAGSISTLSDNILVSANGGAAGFPLSPLTTAAPANAERNCYWAGPARTQVILNQQNFTKLTLLEWQSDFGVDDNSLAVNPQFRDELNGDYSVVGSSLCFGKGASNSLKLQPTPTPTPTPTSTATFVATMATVTPTPTATRVTINATPTPTATNIPSIDNPTPPKLFVKAPHRLDGGRTAKIVLSLAHYDFPVIVSLRSSSRNIVLPKSVQLSETGKRKVLMHTLPVARQMRITLTASVDGVKTCVEVVLRKRTLKRS